MTLADRLIDLNRWYEGLPDTRRVFVYPAVLVAAGFVNNRLTGAPIGWVSLSALVALIVVRRSYVSGWLAAQVPAGGAVPDTRHRALSEPVAPAAVAKPEPVRPAAAVVAKSDPIVPVVVAERRTAEPAAHLSPQVAAQPISRAVPAPAVPAAAPVTRVEAATATPPSPPPAQDNQAKSGKRSTAPAGRKHEGKSGKRKPGDKHAH
jgi:hypothetical protein